MNNLDQIHEMLKAQEIVRLTCRNNKGYEVYAYLKQIDKEITYAINLMMCTKGIE